MLRRKVKAHCRFFAHPILRFHFLLLFFLVGVVAAATQNSSCHLTLIPPSPVSDQITLSMRGAVWNYSDAEKEYMAAFYLDQEEESALLHQETLRVPAHSARSVYFDWQTRGHAGRHEVIFMVRDDESHCSVQPLRIIPSKSRSIGLINGAWSGFYMWGNEGLLWNDELVKMNEAQWRELVRAMDEIGMNIIVLQEVFRNQEYVGAHQMETEDYHGRAFYPSALFPGRMDINTKDPLEVILSEADKRGMYVFVPVGLYAWFDFTEGSLQWHKKVADELWQRYGHHPSFYGWYVSEEIHGALSPNDKDKEIMNRRHKEIVHFFKEFQAHVRSLAPDKPVMLASNCHWIDKGLDVYPKLLPYIDILTPFGFHRMPKGDMTGEEAATLLQKLCDQAGTHFWLDLEAFLFGEHGELYPRPIEGLLSDLQRFLNFEKILCFQFSGLFNAPWMSRKPGGEATVKLYRDYKNYYEKKIKEFENQELADNSAIPLYRNPAQPIEKRVEDLLRRMTLREKVDMVSGNGFTTKRNIRLGIPEIVMTDGPLGPNGKGRATNYSACINMAATWDTDLMHRVAVSMGQETRVLGYNMLLGPCINIARVPQGGRTFESFGEDPYLMSRMAAAYINSVQSQRVIACAKHFAVNNQEWNRGVVDVHVDERTLREIYFPAFKAAVQSGVGSIMAAYNRFRGAYCCSNKYLLTDVLKNDWGFDGFVVSDWGGVHNTVQTANSGLDLEMPDGKFLGDSLLHAIQRGQVEEKIVDDKVRRILRVMFRTGLFDESVKDYGGLADTPQQRALALEVARKSIVLLKNENHVLPLDRKKIASLAVIGPNADDARMYGGGSGYLNAHYAVSPLQGMREKVGDDVTVTFVKGGRLKRQSLPPVESELLSPPDAGPGEHGLLGEYFNNRELQGEPVLRRIDPQVDFSWGEGSPAPGIVNDDKFSARWTGTLTAPGSGVYELGVMSDNGCRLYLDGKLLIDSWIVDKASSLRSAYVELEEGQRYNIRVEFFENIGTCEAHLGLAYYGQGDEIEQAAAAAKKADAAIICAGLRETLEGEGNDRESLALPEDQVKLIKAVAEANPRTIVVLNNATPILLNDWLDDVPALIEAFYPGQEGGHALADILFGDVNPSGKLPLTFPKRWQDCPAYGTYPGPKDSVTYREGIFVGYRWFDKKDIEPLFPFGHGLSYTRFEYSDLRITPDRMTPADTAAVECTVKNTGAMAGEEVVQLYVQDVAASVEREVKALKGFQRITLKPGESKEVSFRLDKKALSFYDVKNRRWLAEPGYFKVLIGRSSRDIRLEKTFYFQRVK